jgi:hypothetical protein
MTARRPFALCATGRRALSQLRIGVAGVESSSPQLPHCWGLEDSTPATRHPTQKFTRDKTLARQIQDPCVVRPRFDRDSR